MAERFEAGPILAGLKQFQRNTVDHVMERFYGGDPTRRFLVADQTGMGKSVVARGVIASLVERLQDDSDVQRIDIVYVCSNADIANQNIKRLNVVGDTHLPFASRLTLLAKEADKLTSHEGRFAKPVNLVSFTPGTSFDMGWSTGKSEERALLYLILRRELGLSRGRATAALKIFQGTVSTPERFQHRIDRLCQEMGPNGWNDQIAEAFLAGARQGGLLDTFEELVDSLVGGSLSQEKTLRARQLTGQLRVEIARAGVSVLEPDLVILDEFQRFRHLLDENGSDAALLAHHLFNHRDARVLLLSATPYKPFTYADESDGGDDHYRDFLQTLSFLANGSAVAVDHISKLLSKYRQAAATGQSVASTRDSLRIALLQLMCRTERPQTSGTDMLEEVCGTADDLAPEDLAAYVRLKRIAGRVDAAFGIDYWKSAPYFINFLEGYKFGDRLKEALSDNAFEDFSGDLAQAQRLDPDALRRFEPVDFGNARLRHLAAETVGKGWWKLLWIPPSMPYTKPEGPYGEHGVRGMTKRLIFSSWAATPTAIASLLSYEAERNLATGSERLTENTSAARKKVTRRLQYSLSDGTSSGMMTMALFWPNPALAQEMDPLELARTRPDIESTIAEIEHLGCQQLAGRVVDGTASGTAFESAHWSVPFSMPGAVPLELRDLRVADVSQRFLGNPESTVESDSEPPDDVGALGNHIELALAAGDEPKKETPPNLSQTVVQIGLHGPGNIAWRSLARMLGPEQVGSLGHWQAAARIAEGLRSLFNRLESTLLLDKLELGDTYWRAVLRYCAMGNLQAVLDEYVFNLASDLGGASLDDDGLMKLAGHARDALSMRPSRYTAFDPMSPSQPISLMSRFALRYGSKRDSEESVRQPELRNAFNSPFWPFVLATTSVGQEGIDLHWWCHAVFHWNLVANPVDFEQREGRVDRYGGHAIRRNIAHRHRASVLNSSATNPWAEAFAQAVDQSKLGELSPYWVYPGPAKIERHVVLYPLSVDHQGYERMKDDLVLYRLTFGQPRQEDLLELLKRRGVQGDKTAVEELYLDLRP